MYSTALAPLLIVPFYLKVVFLLFGQRCSLFLPKVVRLYDERDVDRSMKVFVQHLWTMEE